MHDHLEKALAKDKNIEKALSQAFESFEKEWVEIASKSFKGGFPKAAYVGSCALVTVVSDGKVYVANAGDSKGVILRKKTDGYERIKLSTTFNANKKYE